ncbi:MAG TPA: hypothetical protein VGL02_27400, partial [Streptomyces sp.]
MPLPISLTLVPLHTKIVGPDGTPATGTISARIPHPLRDTTGNVVVGPTSITATLDSNGEATLQLPATDDPDITPSGWTYRLTIATDLWRDAFPIQVPIATAGTLELADVAPAVAVPTVVTYALASQLTGYATKEYVDSAAGTNLPLFNVDRYGALGDGTTDDYLAIRAAWDAMLASPAGGLLYFPRAAIYRISATPTRLGPTTDKAYALFPLPMIASEAGPLKRTFGVLGVGEAASVRTASSFGSEGNPAQIATASVLKVDYSTPFTWSASNGLPSVFGAPDADITGHPTDNTISNLHFKASGLIVRQPDNPSLCGMNLELVSTASLDNLRFDVASVLDDIPEPTRPTGAALLAPKSNNNVAVELGALVFEGHYTGVPFTEHVNCRSAIMLRCKIAVSNRRPCTHMGDLNRLKIEQCTFGFAGYDPAGTGPNLGVVPWYGGTVNNVSCNFEHFAYFGQTPWSYTPTQGCDFYAPNGGLSGRVYVFRVNSEPAPPGGIGIAPFGGSASVYVRAPLGGGLDFSDFGIYTASGGAAQRLLGTAPSNPPTTPPNAPTIGTATAGTESATVTFTPAGSGPTATGYTARAYRASDNALVGSHTGSASPLTVIGLTAGTPVY